MRQPLACLCACLLGLGLAVPRSADAADSGKAADLAGLWQAKKRFGPDVTGAMTIVRDGGAWRATIAGWPVPAPMTAQPTAKGEALAFTLPGGQGAFHGRIEDGGKLIRGHWVQPRTVTDGMAFSSPVVLTADGPGRWRGEIRPLQESFTLYLQVAANPDGTARVFLRNPERNVGARVELDRLQRDGDHVTLFGRPGGGDKDVPVASGAYDADNQVISIYIAGRGGTYDFTWADADSGFYPRPRADAAYAYRPPLARDDGWPVTTLDQVGISRPEIERFVQMLIDTPIDSAHAPEIHGVLIARHGRLALEEYFHGQSGDLPHDTRSAAKSLVSVLIGAEAAAGAPIGPSTPVYATMSGSAAPAGLDPRKRAMTLEHLMSMSSGFWCDDRDPKAPGNEDVMQNQDAQPDWYRYALDLPMAAAPGQTMVYCSTNPNLAAGMLAKVTGEPLDDAFDRLIARPLQFGPYALDLQPTGEVYGGGGAQLRPRDFMKLGQLMLDGGVWHGRRILTSDWVKRSTAPSRELRGLHYGWFWWGIDLPWRGKTLSAFYAAGNGGQVVIVVPSLDLVIAIYGGNYSDKVMYQAQEVYTPRYILPAVR